MQWPNGKERKLEDLKARYYALARQLLTAREGGEAAVANHVMVKQHYNPEQERCAAHCAVRCLNTEGGT